MNAYTTMASAKIQQRDISTVLRGNRFTAAAALAALERQRGWQAEAERDWLLKRNGVKQNSLVSLLRQMIGGALVRAGDRLAGDSWKGIAADGGTSTGAGMGVLLGKETG